MQNLFDTLTNVRNRIADVIGTAGEEEETEEAFAAAESHPQDEKKARADASEEKETEKKSEGRWSAAAIMKIVIYVLIVAIIIEFAVIGIKLFAPNSQGAVLINRIEQTISGEDILSTISVDSYTLEDGTEASVQDPQE